MVSFYSSFTRMIEVSPKYNIFLKLNNNESEELIMELPI